ncbi:glycosyltransferase [Treponema sp. OMZ 788]|uniref:glycosyltransferase n=1 Tax=Treponema sp. OMZ 788 TaxID=2563664 RepID=UPI0021116D38|nr:glycosyltransferase [Treponema sp. OMZ 788]UTC65817.1 glycosyltransferase [Treponema sp. OMZ 788]
MTARRLVSGLINMGCNVRVISTGKKSEDKFTVNELKFPVFDKLIKSQGMMFAKPDADVLYEAIKWADLVHFVMPFFLSVKGLEIAQKLNKPHTAAFHVQPQNITYSIGLGKSKLANDFLYYLMKNSFYKHFRHIHCPTMFIANQIKEHGYDAETHVISNGVAEQFTYKKTAKPKEFENKFVILMIGRLSKEKRQEILIHAAAKSKYAEKIQLIFAGKGPQKRKYEKLSKHLKNKPIFTFCTQDELIKIISYSDLYVHTADAEIEAISCIEAFSCGLVPIIANSPQSATPQFALDERSLFIAGDADDLAKKIDYWLDNSDERKRQEIKYAEYGKEFAHDACLQKMILMFEKEIKEFTEKSLSIS